MPRLFRSGKSGGVAWGGNIGHEMDGKNKDYNRPVLVLRKFNKQIFRGIPLTTKIKLSPHYHQIKLHGNADKARC